MSNLKKRVQKEKIRRQIFDLIQEYSILQELTPDYDPAIASGPTTGSTTAPTPAMPIAYKRPGFIDETVKELENKVKTVATAKCFNGYVAANDEVLGTNYLQSISIPMNISNVTKDTNINLEIDEKIKKLRGSNNKIALLEIKRIIDTIKITLENNDQGKGGPTGKDMFKMFVNTKTIFTNSEELTSELGKQKGHISDAIKEYQLEIEKIYKNKSDSFYNEKNAESYIRYLIKEFRGKSFDTPSMFRSLQFSLVTLGTVDFIENPDIFSEEDYNSFQKALTAFFGGAWTFVDAVDFFYSIPGSLGVATLAFSGLSLIGKLWIFVILLEGQMTYNEMLIKHFDYSDIFNSLEKTFIKINEIVFKEVEKEIENIVLLEEEKAKSNLSNRLANISESLIVEMYNISQKYRNIAGSFRYFPEEAFNDPDNPAYDYAWSQEQYFDNPEFSDEPSIDPEDYENLTDREKNLYNFDMARNAEGELTNRGGGFVPDFLIDDDDFASPKDAEIFIKFFQNKNKESNTLIPDVGSSLATMTTSFLDAYARVLAYRTVDSISVLLASGDVIPEICKTYIKNISKKINDNTLSIFSKEEYANWEKAVINSSIKNKFVKNNNKFNSETDID